MRLKRSAPGALTARRAQRIDPDRTSKPTDSDRYAILVAGAVHSIALEMGVPESEVRNVLYRIVRAGRAQGRRAPGARAELGRALGPSMVDLDLVPEATVQQARRLASLRGALLGQGAFSTSAIAEGRCMSPSAVRTWLSRQRKTDRLFTVSHEGETLVPAFLLDELLEPRDPLRPAISTLRGAGEDGWALWAWFATPSPWLGGQVPVLVAEHDPERVAEAAQRRAASAS